MDPRALGLVPIEAARHLVISQLAKLPGGACLRPESCAEGTPRSEPCELRGGGGGLERSLPLRIFILTRIFGFVFLCLSLRLFLILFLIVSVTLASR